MDHDCRVDVHVHNGPLDRPFWYDELVKLIDQLGVDIMQEFDDLGKAVQTLTDAVTKTATALDDLAAKLASNPTPAQVKDLSIKVQAQADALNAAVGRDDPPVTPTGATGP